MLPTDNAKIINYFHPNQSLLESVIEREKVSDKTEELTSISYSSNLKQKIVSGAVTFLLTLSTGSSAVKSQNFFKTPSSEQVLSDIVAGTNAFNEEIEQEVQMISAWQKSYREKQLIDGVETESPLMPPKRRFNVKLKIRNIKKGQPSICEEIEV